MNYWTDNQQLSALFRKVQQQHRSSIKRLDVKFHPFRRPKHVIEWTPWRIHIKVSDHFQDAPPDILECLAIILLAKVYGWRVRPEIRRQYKYYLTIISAKLPPAKQKRLDKYQPCGRYYNLEEIFRKINEDFFDGELKQPLVGWSRNKSYTRLGFFDEHRNLLVISRIFDSKQVPPEIVQYLMFHEMLHMKIPAVRKNGRRIVHPAAFKKIEQAYPQYDHIQKWIQKNRVRL